MALPAPKEWAVAEKSHAILDTDLAPHFRSFAPFFRDDFPELGERKFF